MSTAVKDTILEYGDLVLRAPALLLISRGSEMLHRRLEAQQAQDTTTPRSASHLDFLTAFGICHFHIFFLY